MGVDTLAQAGYDALRSDGRPIRIRPVRPGDRAALDRMIDRVSDRTIYHRFFSTNRRAAHEYVHKVVSARHQGRALVATARHVVGLAGFERIDDIRAEVALLIDDEHQHVGLGTLFLEELAVLARDDGIEEFVAEVMLENQDVITLFRDFGAPIEVTRSAGGEEHVVCRLRGADIQAAVDRRDGRAVAASLQTMLAPRSVAIVGASDRPRSAGRALLESVLTGGFTGPVYPVNPQHAELMGLPAWPSVSALPEPPDLAIVAVPARAVLETVRACGRRGVRSIVLVTAGFRELGPAGASLEDEVLRVARQHGMRLVGPNCLGLVNTAPDVQLRATLAPLRTEPGGLGLASQSGAVGIAVAAAAEQTGVGLSQFVSLGNKADVSGNDLLMWFGADPRTSVVALYLESVRDPRKFLRLARELSTRKPVVLLKSGRSAAGRRAGASHTAAAASADHLVDALCRQAGILRVDSMDELVDVSRVLLDQRPAGPRLAIVGNSGGPEILAADAAREVDLTVPELSERTRADIERLVPAAAGLSNPVDLGAGMTPDQLAAVAAVLVGSGEVDGVAVVAAQTAAAAPDELVRSAASVSGAVPIAVGLLGVGSALPEPAGVPVFPSPERTVRALGLAWRQRSVSARATDGEPRAATSRASGRLDTVADGTWLDPETCTALLCDYGITGADQLVVSDVDAAVVAADKLGYPVVAKAIGIVHKSDVGGVRLGLADADEVRLAVRDLLALSASVLIQATAPSGSELIVGAIRDEQMGPVVMVGAGGVTSDLLADRAFGLAPLSAADARNMVDELRSQALFDGFRGAAPIDRDAVCGLLSRVSALIATEPRIAELDLNPVIGIGGELHLVDVKIRVAAPGSAVLTDPLTRALRSPR